MRYVAFCYRWVSFGQAVSVGSGGAVSGPVMVWQSWQVRVLFGEFAVSPFSQVFVWQFRYEEAPRCALRRVCYRWVSFGQEVVVVLRRGT